MCEIFHEYLTFSIPSSLFILAFFIRYMKIKNFQSSPKLIDKTIWFDDDDDYSPIKIKRKLFSKPTSLLLKIGLSKILCYIYIFEAIIGLLVPEDVFFISCQSIFSLNYIIGAASWWMSTILLRIEYEKELPQACYTHRMFWILAFSIRIVALAFTKDFMLNVIFNIIMIVLLFPLFLYALFKSIDPQNNNTTVHFRCSCIFEKIENSLITNLLIRAFSSSDIKPTRKESSPIHIVSPNKSSPSSANKESPAILANTTFKINLNNIGSEGSPKNALSSNSSLPPINSEKHYFSLLPKRRTISINRTPFVETENDNAVIYYQIMTHMDFRLYTTNRNYYDFLQLQKDMLPIINENELTKINNNNKVCDLPTASFDQRKFIESLEKYLQSIIQNLVCVNSTFLKFLNVTPEDQIPFIKYQEYLSRSKTSILKKNKINITRTNSNNSKPEEYNFSLSASPAKPLFIFDIICLNWKRVGEEGEDKTVKFEFQLTNHFKKPVQIWKIQKKFLDVKNFHMELENQLRKEINLFNELVPRASNYNLLSDEFLDQRKRGLEKYMQSVMSDKIYYCNCLYEFIEFDVDNERPISLENENDSYVLSNSKRDSIQPNAFTFVFDHQDEDPSEVLVLDLSKATPRHLKVFKQQKQNNESWSPYFKTEEKRWISGIDFNFVSVKLVFIKSMTQKQDFLSSAVRSNNGDKHILYYINLEEYLQKSNREFKTRTLIKMVKKYQDFKALNQILWATYKDIDDNVMTLPPDIVDSEFNANEMKRKWDDYFYHLLKIPKIEQNESFRDFFNLNRLGSNFEFNRGESEIFDFT